MQFPSLTLRAYMQGEQFVFSPLPRYSGGTGAGGEGMECPVPSAESRAWDTRPSPPTPLPRSSAGEGRNTANSSARSVKYLKGRHLHLGGIMANLKKRLSENVLGDFFVDSTCID